MTRIRKDDTVQVIAGKSKGKTGKVHRVIPKESRVIVEGANIVKRHVRPRPGIRQAGIVEMEAPIHLSNVMLVCSRCDRPTRVGFRYLEDGTKVRYCKRCQEVIESR
ncbi:MAG: 50S ribosomal protein L24 [Chloroflexi bacterium]|nr:50S ribosomal protein L24 [Chloroflexota bacterium]